MEQYIRFGNIPQGERSYNYRDEFLEAGLSCIKYFKKGRSHFVDVSGISAAFFLGGFHERNAFIIEGKQISTGSDGEPVVRKVRIMERIKKGKRIYCNSPFCPEGYFEIQEYSDPSKISVGDFTFRPLKIGEVFENYGDTRYIEVSESQKKRLRREGYRDRFLDEAGITNIF